MPECPAGPTRVHIYAVYMILKQIRVDGIQHAGPALLRNSAADLEGFAHSAAAEAIGAVRKVDAARVQVYGPRSERDAAVACYS